MSLSGTQGRTTVALGALALFVLAVVLAPRPAAAQDTIELTMMYHGSVGGKIAPCG